MTEQAHNQPPILHSVHLGEIKDLPEDVMAELPDRINILHAFAQDPNDLEIWQYVANKALDEADQNTGQPLKLRDVEAYDLVRFAQMVLEASPADRYALTTTEAPNGKLWFDVLYGFHSPSGNVAVENAVKKRLHELGQEKVDLAIDIGSGTGETAEVVAPHAKHMVGLDKNDDLITVARQKHPDIQFIKGDVTKLPFDDNSVDIITSNGLKYSLGREAAEKMYSEITRVLKDGGVYIDSEWVEPHEIILHVNPFGGIKNPDYHPELLDSFVTWRAVLQDMIVDTVSGKLEKGDSLPLSGHKWEEFKLNLGLFEENYRLIGEFQSKLARARMLYKDPARAQAKDREYRRYIRGMTDF